MPIKAKAFFQRRALQLLLLLGLFGLGVGWLMYQREKMVSAWETQKPVVEGQLYQLPDPDDRYSLSSVRQVPLHEWQAVPAVNFGSTGGTGWALSTIHSPRRQEVWLELETHFLDSVKVWLVSEGTVREDFPLTGYWKLPHATHNPMLHRYFLFPLPLEAAQEYQVFIRGKVIPGFPQRYAVQYWEPADFRAYLRRGDWGWAVFTGITGMVTFIALISYVFHPRRIYLYYAGYVFCLTLYALTNDGWGIFFPALLQQNLNAITIGFFLSLSLCFFLLFSRQFLTIPRDASQPWLRLSPWGLWVIIAIGLAIAQYGVFQQYETVIKGSYRIVLVFALIAALLWVSYIYHALQEGFKPAWLLLLSQVVMIGFYGTDVLLMNTGLVKHALPDMFILRVALVTELVIIAIGWVYRQKLIRESEAHLRIVDAAQKEKIRKAKLKRQKDKIKALQLKNELYSQRDELARDLHDGLISQLTHIISRLDILASSPPLNIQEQLQRLSDFTRGTIQILREVLWLLHQEAVHLQAFSLRLHNFLLRLWQDLENPRLRWQSPRPDPDPILPHLVAKQLLFIAQEATINALKYAGASEVRVRLEVQEATVVLTISDNGRGFDLQAKRSSCYGLGNMRQRAEKVNGGFEPISGPDGTCIKVTVPI
jgi:signal transduction histidine kinase